MKNHTVTRSGEIKPPALTTQKPFGLGDAVASVAQPVARAIDSIIGTKIAGCGGCKKRREALNNIISDLRHPASKNDAIDEPK